MGAEEFERGWSYCRLRRISDAAGVLLGGEERRLPNQEAQMNGKEAVELLARDPGYFIVSIRRGFAAIVGPGTKLTHFSGAILPANSWLVIEADATRREWHEQQIKLFGKVKNLSRGRYFRARLVTARIPQELLTQ